MREELRPMLRLAVPVALGELAWMAMGVVDTMMVGRVGAEALGALSIGRILFMLSAVFGIGLLLGLDTLVARAFGAGDRRDCLHSLVQGTYLALAFSVPLIVVYRLGLWLLEPLGVDPAVRDGARAYGAGVAWGMLPLLVYTAFRRYLQAVNLVRPVMVALITANLVNVGANWVLIFGRLGVPALGVAGAGWATSIALTYMAGFLAVVARLERDAPWPDLPSLAADWRRMRELLALGFPAAVQIVLEVGVFTLATLLAGRFPPAALAAHQVALVAASVTYMVPLGISSAAAVRVGQELGRRNPAAAARAGWLATALSGGFMTLAAVAFVVFPRALIRLFTDDPLVIPIGVSLLLVAAVFQLFDGVCAVAIGALRGLGDTRNPMLWTLVSYWVFALPLSWYLAFRANLGVLGLWIGLCAGLILASLLILLVWTRHTAVLKKGDIPLLPPIP